MDAFEFQMTLSSIIICILRQIRRGGEPVGDGGREEAIVTRSDDARTDTSETPRRGRPTSAQREKRRRRMLERSLQVFLERGYQGSTLEELARASGVTKRTIYTDYVDKEGLFAAMVESLAGGISHGPGVSGETLESLAARIVYRIHSDELVGLHRLVIAESPRFPQLARAFYQRTDARHIEALRAHLVGRFGAQAGPLAPALFSLLLGERHRQRLLGVRRAASKAEADRIAREAIGRLGLGGAPTEAAEASSRLYPQELTQRTVGDEDHRAGRWVEGVPAAFEPIVIVEPDASWPAVYRRESERIRVALGDVVVRIEHVGSTSVPALPAKPIVDIDVQVPDSSDETSYVPALVAIGYRHVLREPWWNGHRMLVRTDGGVNLHVFQAGSPEPLRHLLFRDWLRTHADDRDLYAAAKRRLAVETADDPDSYSLDKNTVIDEIYSRIFSVPPQQHPAWPRDTR